MGSSSSGFSHPREGVGLAWIRAIPLFWWPLCHVSGLVRRWDGPCYWKTHLSCSAHSLLSSCLYLISRREKTSNFCDILLCNQSVRGCEKEEMHHKFLPWQNRVECICVCVSPTTGRVDVLFTAFVLSVFTSLRFWHGQFFNWQLKVDEQSMIFFCLFSSLSRLCLFNYSVL